MAQTMSQKVAREGLGNPELFKGGVFITKNGVAELFVQTAAEREAELVKMEEERQINALFKLAMIAKQEVADEKGLTPEEVLQRLRDART